jgi:hypothetical protein
MTEGKFSGKILKTHVLSKKIALASGSKEAQDLACS